MQKTTQQQLRVSDIELATAKRVFAENDVIIHVARKAMFFMPLDSEDVEHLKVFEDEDVQDMMRTIFMPHLSATIPLGQNIDLWMSIKDIKDFDEWHTKSEIEGRAKLMALIKYGLKNLSAPSKKGSAIVTGYEPDLSKPIGDVLSDMIARNTYITHVEQQLNQIRTLAGMKTESVEEAKARLTKNSSK